MMVAIETNASTISNKIKNEESSIVNFWFSTSDAGIGSLVIRLEKVDLEISCIEVGSSEVAGIIISNVGLGIEKFGDAGENPGTSCKDVEIDSGNVEVNNAYSGTETVDICGLDVDALNHFESIMGLLNIMHKEYVFV